MARSTLSNYVGQKNFEQAKNAQLFYTFLCILTGILLITILFTQLDHVSAAYSNIPEVQTWIYYMILIYSIGIVPDMLTGLHSTTLRILNKTDYVVVIVNLTFVLQMCLVSWLLVFGFDLKALGLLISYDLAVITCNA